MTKETERGKRLSLYEKVYRELDATMIGAERQRNVDDMGEKRYDMYDEICVDDECIVIHSDKKERLNLAERVAKYYGAPYTIKEELWRRDPKYRYSIYINIAE